MYVESTPPCIHHPSVSFNPRRDVAVSLSGDIIRAARARRDVPQPPSTTQTSTSSATDDTPPLPSGPPRIPALLQALNRRHLVFFAGKIGQGSPFRGGKLRVALRDSLQDTPEALIVEGQMSRGDYERALRESVFCLCPRGSRGWSPRLMEAVWYGCIPVVLADDYWMPQGCFWDWTALAVLIPEKDALKTKERLMELSLADVRARQRGLLQVGT